MAQAPKTEPAQFVSLRLTVEEHASIVAGAEALHIALSPLIYTAALEAAHALGYYGVVAPVARARPGTWRDAPKRREDESATRRISLSVLPLHLRTIAEAAIDQLGEDFVLGNARNAKPGPVQAFLVGSTLRYLSNLKKQALATARHKHATREERELARRLKNVPIPEQYL